MLILNQLKQCIRITSMQFFAIIIAALGARRFKQRKYRNAKILDDWCLWFFGHKEWKILNSWKNNFR